MIVDIKGLEKYLVLKALYDNAKPVGYGILHFKPEPMSEEDAKELIKNNPSLYFDYIYGRPLKVDLSKDEFDAYNYDRDNPSAQLAIDKLFKSLGIDNKSDPEVRYDTWVDLLNHDISDTIINLYNKIGGEGLNILCKFINDKFDDYYKPFKEFFSENKEETDNG